MMQRYCSFLLLGVMLMVLSAYAFARHPSHAEQINRYTTVHYGVTPAQRDPLLAVATFHFPPSVTTVGQALSHALATTGYQLSDKLSPLVKATLLKPLPLTDRVLGPVNIETALRVLMGESVFILERDPVHRLVNFKVNARIAKQLGLHHE